MQIRSKVDGKTKVVCIGETSLSNTSIVGGFIEHLLDEKDIIAKLKLTGREL